MCRSVIVFTVAVFLFISTNAQEAVEVSDLGNDCILRGGAIGKFVPPEECQDDNYVIVNRFGPPSKPIKSGNLLCCRNTANFIANNLCTKLAVKRKASVIPQILGGTAVAEGEFPHIAAIGYMLPGVPPVLSFQCGGTLISDQYVLTAAHCIFNKESLSPHLARLGTLNKWPTKEANFDTANTDYLVTERIAHPTYNRIKRHHDIALLKLERPVDPFTLTIFPACLGTDKADPKEILSIAGWGKIIRNGKENDTSQILLKASMETVSSRDCTPFYNKGSWARNNPNGVGENQMCAKGAWNNTDGDTCQGDSGGPLQLQVNNSSLSQVVGVTAFGPQCGNNVPGIYTRVSSYLSWILKTAWPDDDYSFADSDTPSLSDS